MDLERELRSLQVDWPRTPAFRPALEQRAARGRRRLLLAAALALALAVAVAFAVPQSRGAILRFFHVGADTIHVVDTLPAAEERPLDANLGRPTALAVARRTVPQLLVPPLERLPTLYEASGVVSMVFRFRGDPVLLSELRSDAALLKKLASGQTRLQWVEVSPSAWGAWLTGAPHVFFFPREPARLAGNTLVWHEGDTTYRLESPHLDRRTALDLARSLRDTP